MQNKASAFPAPFCTPGNGNPTSAGEGEVKSPRASVRVASQSEFSGSKGSIASRAISRCWHKCVHRWSRSPWPGSLAPLERAVPQPGSPRIRSTLRCRACCFWKTSPFLFTVLSVPNCRASREYGLGAALLTTTCRPGKGSCTRVNHRWVVCGTGQQNRTPGQHEVTRAGRNLSQTQIACGLLWGGPQMHMQMQVVQPSPAQPPARLGILRHSSAAATPHSTWPAKAVSCRCLCCIRDPEIGPSLRSPRISSPGPHIRAISRPYNRMFSPQLSPDFSIIFSTCSHCFPRWRAVPCTSLAIYPG